MPSLTIRPYESGDPVQAVHERALRDAGGYVDPEDFPDGIDPDADLRNVRSHYLDAGGVFLVAALADGASAADSSVDSAVDETPGESGVVGTAALRRIDESSGEVTRMRVLPAYQDQGIGRRLLREVEAAAREMGVTEFVLDTAPHLEAAQALYERAGYEAKGLVETPVADYIVYRKRR